MANRRTGNTFHTVASSRVGPISSQHQPFATDPVVDKYRSEALPNSLRMLAPTPSTFLNRHHRQKPACTARSKYAQVWKEGNTLRYLPREIRDIIYEMASRPDPSVDGPSHFITIPNEKQGINQTPYFVPKWCNVSLQIMEEATPRFISTCHFTMHSIQALQNLIKFVEIYDNEEIFIGIRELTFSGFTFTKSTWPIALDLIRLCKGLKYLEAKFDLQDLFHNNRSQPVPRSLVDIVEIYQLDEVLDLENLLVLELSACDSGTTDKEYKARKKIWREVEWWVHDEMKKRKRNREFGLFTGRLLFDSPLLPDDRQKVGWKNEEEGEEEE